MSRPTRPTKIKIIIGVVFFLLVVLGAVYDVAAHRSTTASQSAAVHATTTVVTYRGQNGQNALQLLKMHAKVVTKSSSLGDYVVSINGNDGGGTKYWLFYVNGKQAQVGAASYVTHDGEIIQWKLEK